MVATVIHTILACLIQRLCGDTWNAAFSTSRQRHWLSV